MSHWKPVKIVDICDLITSGGTPLTSIKEYYIGGNIPWIKTKEVNQRRIYESDYYITKSGLENSSAKLIPENSIIIAMYGDGKTAGRVALNKVAVTTNQACCNLILNKKIAYHDFIFYNLMGRYDELVSKKTGSGQQNLNSKIIKEIDVLLPSFNEQKAIASVLSSLDEKIDLLHRQNKTLESMAENLFRQWFIDGFENKITNSDLEQLIKLQSGYAFKSKDFTDTGAYKVIKIKNITGNVVDIKETDFLNTEVGEALSERFHLKTGQALIAMTGAEIGKLGLIPKNKEKLVLNQRVGLLKPKFYGAEYLAYLYLNSEIGQDYIKNAATGSAQPNISASQIEACPFPEINIESLKYHATEIKIYFDKIVYNLGNIETLEKIRDTLLPKLMSGEVRVQYAEEAIASVA